MSEIIYEDPNRFYVYTYHSEDDTIYYVGKGVDKRINAWHKNIPVPQEEKNRRVLQKNLSESEAFQLEIEQIKLYGRLDIGTGILLNKTNGGGCGTSGYKHSDVAKAKISEAHSGENHPNYGQKASPKTVEKMRASRLGKKASPATLEKMKESRLGKKLSPETIEKLSGENHHFYAKKHTPESIDKMRKAKLGKKASPATLEKMTGENHHNYGKKVSPETLEKMREAKSGENNPMFGKKQSEQTKNKRIETRKRNKAAKILLIQKEIVICEDFSRITPWFYYF